MELVSIKRNNLLTIRGVHPKDFTAIVESFNKVARTEPVETVYTEMPRRFTTTETWPTFSNLKCWECDLLPAAYPRFVPINPEIDPNNGVVCDVHGHFDDWSCAASYIVKVFPRDQQWDMLRLLCIIEAKFTGKQREKIMPAPPKTIMSAYCGKIGITSKQYREKIAALNIDYELSSYKMEHFKGGD